MIRNLGRYFAFAVRLLLLAVDYARALVGSAIYSFTVPILDVAEGADPNKTASRYAVYVTHDRYGLVADYVVGQIAALTQIGYRVLVISTSRQLPPAERAKLQPHCWQVIRRRNLGHDFGGYKDGIQRILATGNATCVILMNDSCYGPLFDLRDVEDRAEASGDDVWGITEGWWKRYHVQSYFLRIGRRALEAPEFKRFWATLLPYQPRRLVILNGEIRFTQFMVRAGLRVGVLCPYHDVARRTLKLILDRLNTAATGLLATETAYLSGLATAISAGHPVNPMHSFWDVLIAEFNCPFIKRDLLRRNPMNVPDLVEVHALIANNTSYDPDLIYRHLKVH